MTKVYLTLHGIWADIISSSGTFILAKDIDGVNTYVVRDGMERVR